MIASDLHQVLASNVEGLFDSRLYHRDYREDNTDESLEGQIAKEKRFSFIILLTMTVESSRMNNVSTAMILD